MIRTILLLLYLPLISSGQMTSLEKAINRADPGGNFDKLILQLRIQEPRVGNPGRFSEVFLDNKTGAFSVDRNRDEKIATYSIDEKGIAEVALDGQKNINPDEKEKYRLDPVRNINYRNYYKYLYGLPMILQDEEKFTLVSSTEVLIDGKSGTEHTFQLSTPVFASIWKISFMADGTLKKLDFYNATNPQQGEYIIFDGTFELGGITIPRFRHWHDKTDGAYLGSDIIVYKLSEH